VVQESRKGSRCGSDQGGSSERLLWKGTIRQCNVINESNTDRVIMGDGGEAIKAECLRFLVIMGRSAKVTVDRDEALY
jgi:hypothetical protein